MASKIRKETSTSTSTLKIRTRNTDFKIKQPLASDHRENIAMCQVTTREVHCETCGEVFKTEDYIIECQFVRSKGTQCSGRGFVSSMGTSRPIFSMIKKCKCDKSLMGKLRGKFTGK